MTRLTKAKEGLAPIGITIAANTIALLLARTGLISMQYADMANQIPHRKSYLL